jgi:uncharacterized C2H2 Zn-finger protein
MFLLCVLFAAICFAYDEEAIIRHVNKNAGWKAGRNDYFKNKDYKQIKSMFGIFLFLI